MQTIKAIVYDLDGTLVDTAPDLQACLNSILSDLGRPAVELGAIRMMIGDGARALLRRGLDATGGMEDNVDIEVLFDRFIQRYTADPIRLGRAFDGVPDVLELFAAAGIRQGVCTNKPQLASERILTDLGLRRHFCAILGGDLLPVRKPDPRHLIAVLERLDATPAEAVMIGDSMNDLATARAAKVPCILVSFGYSAVAARDMAPDFVIGHFGELPPLLEAIDASAA